MLGLLVDKRCEDFPLIASVLCYPPSFLFPFDTVGHLHLVDESGYFLLYGFSIPGLRCPHRVFYCVKGILRGV